MHELRPSGVAVDSVSWYLGGGTLLDLVEQGLDGGERPLATRPVSPISAAEITIIVGSAPGEAVLVELGDCQDEVVFFRLDPPTPPGSARRHGICHA